MSNWTFFYPRSLFVSATNFKIVSIIPCWNTSIMSISTFPSLPMKNSPLATICSSPTILFAPSQTKSGPIYIIIFIFYIMPWHLPVLLYFFVWSSTLLNIFKTVYCLFYPALLALGCGSISILEMNIILFEQRCTPHISAANLFQIFHNVIQQMKLQRKRCSVGKFFKWILHQRNQSFCILWNIQHPLTADFFIIPILNQFKKGLSTLCVQQSEENPVQAP